MSTMQIRPRTRPRRPLQDRKIAMRLAATEYDRVIELLESLSPAQWRAETECTGWDVRAMAGHMLGMAQMAASVRETMRQNVAAKKRGGLFIDGLTAVQVEKNASLDTAALVEQFRAVAPKAVRARRRTPSFVRNRTMPEAQMVGDLREWWTFGYLLEPVLTRDPFMHRIDISRATGVKVAVTPEHEGAIVDDVVRDWMERHGEPVTLELTGPAGGSWSRGQGERITMDALEFCRVLSGRAPGSGLLTCQVPF